MKIKTADYHTFDKNGALDVPATLTAIINDFDKQIAAVEKELDETAVKFAENNERYETAALSVVVENPDTRFVGPQLVHEVLVKLAPGPEKFSAEKVGVESYLKNSPKWDKVKGKAGGIRLADQS